MKVAIENSGTAAVMMMEIISFSEIIANTADSRRCHIRCEVNFCEMSIVLKY